MTALVVITSFFVGGVSPTDSASASTAPTVASLSPTFGTTAGGTSVTITGSGFFGGGASGDVSGVTIGGQAATSVTVVSDTELSVVTPARSKGAQAVVVTTSTGGASTSSVFFNYFNILVANPDRIVGFETRAERFEMGELASRTRQRPYSAVQSGGGGLYRVFGVDSNTGEPYSFLTDQNYSLNSGGGNEGFEGGYVASSVSSFSSSVTSTTSGSRQPITLSAPYGFSCSRISSSSTAIPVAFRNSQDRFCSVFGPEIWSNAFYAETGEALSFQYSANSSDEYEPYGFLVKVRDLGGGKFSYGSAVSDDPERADSVSALSTHSIVLYARGRNTSSQGGYVTASGNVPETGHYRFRFVNGSFDGSGGSVLGADFSIDAAAISVARAQSITFPSPGDQVGTSGTFDITVTSSAGLPLNLSTTTASVCDFATSGATASSLSNVTSGSTVAVRKGSAGTCTILANAPAGVGADTRTYVAAELTSRTFQIRASAVAPSNVLPPSISGTASTGETLTAALGDWSDGGDPITGTTYQWKRTKSGTTVNITGATSATLCLADDPDIIGSTISVTVTRTNPRGSASANSTATAAVTQVGACVSPPPAASTGSAGSPPPATIPTVVTPPRVLPRVVPVPPPLVGPVVSGTPSTPPSAPTALVGGRPLAIQTQVTDPNTMSLRAGVLNIGMNIASDQGSVRQQGGSTEIQVRNGGVASVTGSGVLPRSTVQVFMPLGGSNSREIARIPVDATGSFSGDALFGSTPTEAPLPIGRHVLQMVTVDENRQQTVVELTVNIAQPPPAPELNRSTNERPTLLPGQSIATNAGQPEAVTVVALPDEKQARVEGDGWLMAVDVPNADGRVSETPEGGAVLELVRDETAVVSGAGFMPGTRADVWLFSDPTLLGTVDIDENGEFNGEVNIDGNVVAAGEHTLQLQGVGEDGFVRAANLGVVVNDAAPVSTEAAASGFLWWLWLLILLLVVAVLWFALWRYRRSRA